MGTNSMNRFPRETIQARKLERFLFIRKSYFSQVKSRSYKNS
ncbi:hypothetical protein LBBP_03682 [Leptospira borgpetersenii serovar Ballum]|uniref:Uncharacterized protein n=1 Tax=Leptospira borgpetersenii serovar Ballum TaxID=280505 RepID=A0A0S2IW23_LEPBO|nr:hypothetical protein LBBP_03682 [Leptospira borgpetersenii serovar Ballum]